ncbi:MAG: AlwI family type II restriction endonuclease, partial [Muribaculaceae bacterium]|nr:AlwI family type II restriction endonuclease [Muribaculaceae bacterium]
LASEIMAECIRYGIYRPTKQTQPIKDKWKTTPKGHFSRLLLTSEEVNYLIQNNPQQHKEVGFAKGYPSRFATIFDLCKELGLAYFNIGEPIEISELGHHLIDVLEVREEGTTLLVEEVHPEYETEVFLQAFAKSQRKNPFVKVLNDNVPLILLLETIKLLNADPDFNGAGISRKELPLLIFWKNNNAEALYSRIKQLRQKYHYNPSDEVILDICINEIMEGRYKQFDAKSIMCDYPDEFIRKMRMTGLISLRGAGRFIDINHHEDEKVGYVLEHYSTYPAFTDGRAYFDYMANIDPNLFAIKAVEISPSQSEELLKNWVDQYNWNSIKEELNVLSKRHSSRDEVLRILAAPIRLEFLTALAIKSKLPHVRVIPNYVADDTGLPTSTAGGGVGDIECFEMTKGILVEVTMAEGRSQTMMEIWPIERHLTEFKEKYTDDSESIFVAPSIYTDSQRQIDYVAFTSNGKNKIRPYKIQDFIEFLESTEHLYTI